MEGIAVGFGEYSNGFDTHATGGAHYPQRNFSAVGNKDFFHGNNEIENFNVR
jgi:hypothetical protein